MASTMVGQLAGGASFDQAFEAGAKAGATAAITAGITQGIGANTQAGIQDLGGGIVKGTFTADALGKTMLGIGERGIINATVTDVVYGSGFKDALKGSVIGDVAAVGASAIGQTAPTLSVQNVAEHAVLGAGIASLRGQDAVAGAIGGAVSAVAAPLIDSAVSGRSLDDVKAQASLDTAQRVAISTGAVLAGAAAGSLVSNDLNAATTGAQAAANEVTNNFLKHDEAVKREAAKQKLLACTDDSCRQQAQAEVNAWNKLDSWRDAQIEIACRSPASQACQGWNMAIQTAKSSYANYDPKTDLTGSVSNERSQVNNQAFQYQQQVKNPTLYGMGKGLLKLTPPGVATAVGIGAYELTTAIRGCKPKPQKIPSPQLNTGLKSLNIL